MGPCFHHHEDQKKHLKASAIVIQLFTLRPNFPQCPIGLLWRIVCQTTTIETTTTKTTTGTATTTSKSIAATTTTTSATIGANATSTNRNAARILLVLLVLEVPVFLLQFPLQLSLQLLLVLPICSSVEAFRLKRDRLSHFLGLMPTRPHHVPVRDARGIDSTQKRDAGH